MRRDWARGRAERLMPDSGTILRATLVDDGGGGLTPGAPLEIGPILGQFRLLRGEEQIRAQQLGQLGRYHWAVPSDTDIRATDHVRILGVVYQVVWAPPAAAHAADRLVGLEEATPS